MLVLRPTIEHDQWGHGLAGLLSGLVSAAGYLQVVTLGRLGEPESRIVFYFSIGSIVGGAALEPPDRLARAQLGRHRSAAGRGRARDRWRS